METYDLKKDLKVFGKEVKTFPLGVKEAFSALLDMIPEGFKRSFLVSVTWTTKDR